MGERSSRMTANVKRAADVVLAGAASLVLLPLLLSIACMVRLILGPPIFFFQLRPGHRARAFRLVKFRTMSDCRDGEGRVLPDDQRLGRFGRFLRSSSLDELPELWNVLRGELSLVGPRPLLLEYLPRYSVRHARRHEVKPGITGWAQVNGRNSLTWEEKFESDVWYVDHRSLWLDIKILWRTFANVIRREGISQRGHATMPEFMGSPTQSRRRDGRLSVMGRKRSREGG